MQKINNKEYENIDYINKKSINIRITKLIINQSKSLIQKNAADVIEYMYQGHVKHSTQNAIFVTS